MPQAIPVSEITDMAIKVMGVKEKQELGFTIDILQALDGLWLQKAYSRMS